MVRSMPLSGRGDFDAVVVRTDFRDMQAWAEVRDALLAPWGEGYDASVWFVDDPAWADASVDEVLEASRSQEYCPVLFIADAVTMEVAHHALLAVTTRTPEDFGDEEYDALIEFGREFRTIPVGVHWIEVNLALANMDFEEFSRAASQQPDGVFRGFDGEVLT